MFFDLNIPVPEPALLPRQSTAVSKKGKQKAGPVIPPVASANLYSAGQVKELETRIDVLVHLGYTVLGLNQIIQTNFDPKTHVDYLDGLILQLKKREGIIYLKRLTIELTQASEKGFGFIHANQSPLQRYDILSLIPTTQATLSACLACTSPSPSTVHIVSIPLTLPRLPFHLKHTTIRSCIRNGALFELNYSTSVSSTPGSSGETERRNWWACARELARVTNGKCLLFSSGSVTPPSDVRAPNDVINLAALLGIPQNLGKDAISTNPKSLVIRAKTRKTYKAVLSEPILVTPQVPEEAVDISQEIPLAGNSQSKEVPLETTTGTIVERTTIGGRDDNDTTTVISSSTVQQVAAKGALKRQREDGDGSTGPASKKKKKKQKAELVALQNS